MTRDTTEKRTEDYIAKGIMERRRRHTQALKSGTTDVAGQKPDANDLEELLRRVLNLYLFLGYVAVFLLVAFVIATLILLAYHVGG